MVTEEYLARAENTLREIVKRNGKSLDRAAEIIASACQASKTIYLFGCTHSGILMEDVFYRSGAPAFWQPLFVPGLSIAAAPGYLTTALEHSREVGEAVIANSRLAAGDVLLVISTSGKNAAPAAVAEKALERQARLIVLSSSYYREERGNHPRIPSLWALADRAVMLDNCVPKGDVSIEAGGCPMGPLSTIAGSFLMHALSALAVEKLAAAGVAPPVFRSSNAPGGAAFNQKLLTRPGMREKFMLP